MEEMERVRKEVLAKRAKGMMLIGLVLGGALLLTVMLLSAVGAFAFIFGGALAAIGGGIVHHFYLGVGAERYRMMFKERVLAPLIQEVEPGVLYEPQRGIAEHVFEQSGLYRASPDRYASEDLISGLVGKTEVTFSEVHAETKHTTQNANGGTSTTWKTLFQGVLFIADFNKHFRSPVTVLPDVAERTFGWFGKAMQKLSGDLQILESPEFEKHFVVRGADSVETRYLLTPSMQERLIALRGRLGKELRVGFRDSQVWICIPNKSDWFEGDLMKPVSDRGQMEVLLGQLKCCFQIVEELDLNTRIWTKD